MKSEYEYNMPVSVFLLFIMRCFGRHKISKCEKSGMVGWRRIRVVALLQQREYGKQFDLGSVFVWNSAIRIIFAFLWEGRLFCFCMLQSCSGGLWRRTEGISAAHAFGHKSPWRCPDIA